MRSKTLILSSLKQFPSNTPRAIVTFIDNTESMLGKIRLYNLNSLDEGVKMGIYLDGEVKTMDLVRKFDSYEFSTKDKLDLNKEIYCALIDTSKNNDVVLCGGSYSGYFSSDENGQNAFLTPQINEEREEETSFEPKVQEESTPCPNCDCENCEYKKYFYEQHKKETQITPNDNILTEQEMQPLEANISALKNEEEYDVESTSLKSQDNEIKNSPEDFLSQISEQLDEMFERYPLDPVIMNIIPNSKIIKVSDAVDGKPYILGVMYEDDEIKYLVYGVPSNYSQKAPDELGENYNWLPLDVNAPYSEGYYLIYQDASTGKLVPIKVEWYKKRMYAQT